MGSRQNSPIGLVPSHWRIRHIRDIAVKVGSGATPTGGAEVYLPVRQNYALVRSQNVFDRHFDPTGLAYISDQHAHELSGAEIGPDDVLLNITGDGITFARSCLMPNDLLPACVNQHVVIIRADRTQCDPGYLLAFLTHPVCKSYIESFNAGGSRRAITKGHIESFEIPLPPQAEQKAIAHVLGALDDKIELNRRMNETLEAMARAIFKSWFVDFDPVHANAAGCRLQGLDPAIQKLFPAAFTDSPLGPIPKGWTVGTLGNAAANPRRGVQPSEMTAGTPYIGLEHMPRHCIALSEWGVADGLDSGKFRFSRGEILFGKLRPYFHKVGVAATDGVCSTDILVIVPKASVWFSFILGHVSSDEFVTHTNAVSTGTKMPRANWADMARYDVILPSESAAAAFTAQTMPLVDKIRTSIMESRSLAAIRDTLLPKLLNGDLRVPTIAEECERSR